MTRDTRLWCAVLNCTDPIARPGRLCHHHALLDSLPIEVPLSAYHPSPYTTTEVASGQLLGRFRWVENPNWSGGDWIPDPAGTHDAYVYRGSAYLIALADPGPSGRDQGIVTRVMHNDTSIGFVNSDLL